MRQSQAPDRHPDQVVLKRGMVDYRAFTVGADGHFVGVEPMECADDAQAIEKAKQLVDGHDVELWSERLVIRINHEAN
jgi:hypothetical protein